MDYSLDDLDQAKACEVQYEFEVKDDVTAKGTGLFLSVIGEHAQVVQEFTKKELNERRVAEVMAKKRDPRGKNPESEVVPIEQDIDFSTELVAIRITGWRGIKEEFSHKNAIRLCTINPSIKEQVLAVSQDLKKYPTRFSKKPDSTSDSLPG